MSDLDLLTERPVTPWAARPGWGISVDLLPREVLQGRRSRVYRRLVVIGLVLVVLLCGGLTLMSYADKSSAQSSYDDAQGRTSQLTAAARQYADITAATAVLTETQTLAGTLMGQDVDVVNLIARIRHSLPSTVTIGNLAVLLAPSDDAATKTAGGHAVIGTVTISGGGTQIKDVATFVANLNHLRGVVAVVPGSTTQDTDGTSYSLSFSFTDVLYTHRFDPKATR